MKRDLTYALDECLTLLWKDQATLEECLARYPEQASSLRPLLEVALEMSHMAPPVPSPAAFSAGKQRMLRALVEKKSRQTAPAIPFLRHARAFQLVLAAVVVLAVAITIRLVLLPRPEATLAQTARLTQVNGMVEFAPAGSDIWRSASAGEPIGAGSQIRTGPFSTAALVFFDGSTTEVQASTEIAVVQASARPDGSRVIVLRQALGQTYSRVQRLSDQNSRFEIETPGAVIAVRGTEFAVAVEAGGTTHVAVAEGVVEVTAQRMTVAVWAGQETTVQPDEPPSPPTLMPQATPTPAPTRTTEVTTAATVTPVPAPALAPVPTSTAPLSDQMETPESSGHKKTPQPPGQTKTPQPPGQTKTPQPPGQTKTPQPPGQTKTPQPPGQTKTPQPPGQNEPPQPPGQNKPKPPKKS